MAAPLSFDVDRKTATYQAIRDRVGHEKFDAILSKYSYVDPGPYVSKASPAAVLLQYATEEDFITSEISKQYAAVVSEPKTYKLYDSPHALNAAARRDRVGFLAKQLKLKRVSEAAIDKVPELPQPAK